MVKVKTFPDLVKASRGLVCVWGVGRKEEAARKREKFRAVRSTRNTIQTRQGTYALLNVVEATFFFYFFLK